MVYYLFLRSLNPVFVATMTTTRVHAPKEKEETTKYMAVGVGVGQERGDETSAVQQINAAHNVDNTARHPNIAFPKDD